MHELDIFSEENVVLINSFENPQAYFNVSLEINPQLEFEIKKVYNRTLDSYIKYILGGFHLNLIKKVDQMVNNDRNEEIEELILDFTNFIGVFFDEKYHSLKCNNFDELDDLMYILKLCSIMVVDALEEDDVELAFESFFQIESRINREFPLSVIIENLDSPISYNFGRYNQSKNHDLILEGDTYVIQDWKLFLWKAEY